VSAFKTSELITGGSSSDSTLKGEAVAVDLPGGKTFFALLRMANGTSSDDNLAIMSMKAMDPAYNHDRKLSAQRIVSGDGIRSPADVAPADYPMLVTFGDNNDPTSVTRVDPGGLAASFGTGVRLKRIMVEVTDEAVTSGIGTRFPWWGEFQNKHLDGSSTVATDLTTQNIAARLSPGSFTTESIK
jgi:hypothetical protein